MGKLPEALVKEDLALRLFEVEQLPTHLIAERLGVGRKAVERLLREAKARRKDAVKDREK